MDPWLNPETAGVSAMIETVRECQGQPLRFSALGRQLGISRYRVWHCIELLESKGILYSLPAWCPPPLRPGRRTAKSPVVYLREPARPGIHAGVPAGVPEPVVGSPGCRFDTEAGFCSWMIDQVMLRERARCPASRFGHYSTPAMTRAALVVVSPLITVGFQFPFQTWPSKRRWTGLFKSIREGWLDRGLVVYPGRRVFFGSRWVVAAPAERFLADYRGWMEAMEKGTVEALRAHVRAYSAQLPVGGTTAYAPGSAAG
ncbi:MAG: hypothetical protein JW820_15955 [Spirochaetales bacterium]|nr:hypothetical protein [Spirochaetales bacterium]